jgi:RHS repeat-associated protein
LICPGDTPAWTESAVGSEWQRNITGISGTLEAIQSNGGTRELQLTNLHGDIIAKAYLSETATELAAKADTSEYGVPAVNAPAKYSWLGAIELPTELPSGVTAMGIRSYVPELGRFLQPDPLPDGSANAYSYTFGDPVDTTDPSGASTMPSASSIQESAQLANASAEDRAAEIKAAEEAARAEAERRAAAAASREAEAWASYNASVGVCPDRPSCRSGGKQSHGKCQPGGGSGPNNCSYVFGGAGGFVGAAGGWPGAAIGAAGGAWLGEKICGSSKT